MPIRESSHFIGTCPVIRRVQATVSTDDDADSEILHLRDDLAVDTAVGLIGCLMQER